jgi:type II secretory pathway predicted ATPase ExeA/septal ring-binding cell division protein DamX
VYLRFFGFQRPPFELVPDPDFLFLGESHDAAMANVAMGLESGKGFVVISGPVGAGKTTILRAMLRRIGRDQNVCFLSQPESSVHDLLRAILDGFGLEAGGNDLVDLRRALRNFLESGSRPGILIVDEAHLLSEDSLEQLRLLSNLEEDHRKLLQIVLSGQRELKELLSRPRLRPLAQRIEMFYEIEPLGAAEVREYIGRRLRIAGSPDDLRFEARAFEAIHAITGGVPRLINVLTDRALITAYVESSRTITDATVLEAYEDLGEVTQSVMPGAPAKRRRPPQKTAVRELAPPPPLPPRDPAESRARITLIPRIDGNPPAAAGGPAPVAASTVPRLRYATRRRPGRGRTIAWIGMIAAVIVVAVFSLGSDGGGLAAAITGAGQAALQRTGLAGNPDAARPADAAPEDVAGAPAASVGPETTDVSATEGLAAQGPFAIQIASFRNAGRARDYARSHRERTGEATRVSPTEVETGLWHRVLVGEFDTREDVTARMEELREEGDFSFLRIVRLIPGEDRPGPVAGE